MDYSKDDILPRVYIYIIYPSNYKVDDISTRQFYIGSTENYNECKNMFYRDLYSQNTSKKIQIMRNYMQDEKISIENDKKEQDINKFWQIKILFIGINCCTKLLLKALKYLYIYYYYSVINEEEDSDFDPEDIDPIYMTYFHYLELDNYLNFEYEDIFYDVNPYNLINKDTYKLRHYIHIYKDICERKSIPKFESIAAINEFEKEKTIDDFYREFIQLYYGNINNIDNNDNYNKPTYIHSITIEGRYKCRWCEKSYKFYNTSFHSHLVKCHNGDYRGDFDNFKTYKLNPETSY
jgi:hypothetical protein